MSPQVDLYNNSYSNYETDVYRQIRLATYGEDLGQTSWVTNEESREIPQMLGPCPRHHDLEIGCGSGRYAVQIAETAGCRVVGVDINADGLGNGNALAMLETSRTGSASSTATLLRDSLSRCQF